MKESTFKTQIFPIALTAIVCTMLIGTLWGQIVVLNLITPHDILLQVRLVDIFIGLTIYLKTSIDFAIYIGSLMDRNPGWKSRVAIEIGTAVGNAAGTLAVLLIWTFFKEVRWLLALMITLASFVLFKLAEDSLEHAQSDDHTYPRWFRRTVNALERWLRQCNKLVMPILKYVIPDLKVRGGSDLSFWPLFGLSFTIPFVLGLDDFAGYVPLFNIVNVFGFAIGVFAGHMILNVLLYLSPQHTIRAVKNPTIALLGAIVFVGLGVWGLIEVANLIGH